MQTIAQRVIAIVAEESLVEDDPPTPETRFVADLGVDSLDGLMLTMAIEDEFDIEISDEAADACVTVADCIALVERLTAANT